MDPSLWPEAIWQGREVAAVPVYTVDVHRRNRPLWKVAAGVRNVSDRTGIDDSLDRRR